AVRGHVTLAVVVDDPRHLPPFQPREGLRERQRLLVGQRAPGLHRALALADEVVVAPQRRERHELLGAIGALPAVGARPLLRHGGPRSARCARAPWPSLSGSCRAEARSSRTSP